MNELWRDVVGYEGLYQVSSLGRVKSLDRIVSVAGHTRKYNGNILRTHNGEDKYTSCTLSKKGKTKTHMVHILVLRAFVGEPEEGHETLHLDNNKHNPALSNLRYGSHICNMAFNVDNGTNMLGEDHPRSKITEKDVVKMRRLYDSGLSSLDISRKFNLSICHVNKITGNRIWKHLPHTTRKANKLSEKLTPAKVIRIREFRRVGIQIKELMTMFNVSRKSIQNVIHGKTWIDIKEAWV